MTDPHITDEPAADQASGTDETTAGYDPIDARPKPFLQRHRGKFAAAGMGAAAVLLMAMTATGPGAQTIPQGRGLISDEVNFEWAIDAAEHCALPLYRGSTWSTETLISYDDARRLENYTDQVQVTVGVRAGDQFDLRRNVFGVWVRDACPNQTF